MYLFYIFVYKSAGSLVFFYVAIKVWPSGQADALLTSINLQGLGGQAAMGGNVDFGPKQKTGPSNGVL